MAEKRSTGMGVHDGHREKMKQRFQTSGLDGFAEHEVLELLLFYAIPRRDTNVTAHLLMERYGSLAAVLGAPVEDLQKVDGVGHNAAILLTLIASIWKKSRLAEANKDTILNSTEKAGAYLLGEKYQNFI